MSNIINITARACAVIAGVFIVVAAASADVMPSDWRQKLSDEAWEQNLRAATFQDREIFEDAEQNVLEVKAPYRAEDAALTPVSIHTRFPQTDELYVQRMHVFIDKNPVPLVGIFDFTPDSGKADLAMRVRVNDHTYVRVIAELNNGELHMGKSFVRAMGACSAPPPKSIDDSIANMGEMKMKLIGAVEYTKPNLIQLKIKHPNITGLQPMRIGSHVHPPAHFINTLNISYNGAPIMKAQLTFAISMDPSLRFFFVPETEGVLTVEATDTKNARWSSEFAVN
ncbi:MAG: quinoprotein dehydrogenase-associated SoxYZ-like carrier [Gammaproteobacteria bacterium]|nr:quinoprotein dehydrogenase-associated SoxYZ-like carrier [Gammaproteobacteria bacterium]MCY4337633.1 quinoprotein dehydrogenase-associated SoxYZ-like carrier [Gammaproteobacteria bacterium]